MERDERRFQELHDKVTRGGILTPEESTEYEALCARLDATEMIEVKDPTETLTLRERLSRLLALRDELEAARTKPAEDTTNLERKYTILTGHRLE